MPFPPTFSNVWDITFPPDTQLANLLGQDLRNFRQDVMQRMSLLSGTLANRPTPEVVNATWGGVGFGILYFSTDTSQIFQWNNAAWIDISSSFLASRGVAATNLTAQAAAISSTVLYAVPVGQGGVYRASGSIQMTTTGTGGNIRPAFSWNNGTNGQSYQGTAVDATQAIESGSGIFTIPSQTTFLAAQSTNINYQVIFSGVTGAPIYSLRIRLEFMG